MSNLIKSLFVLSITIVIVGCQPTQPPFECTDPLGCVTFAPDEPLKIGVIQALSGGAAIFGQEQLNMIELALAEQDNQLLGHPIALQIEDGLCSSEGGAHAAVRLVADPQIVGIIGTTCSSGAVTASEIMSEAGLVMISGTNSAPDLTEIGGQRAPSWQAGYFRTRQNDALLMRAAATFAIASLGVNQAATVDDGDVYTQGLAEIFRQAFTHLGGEIVLEAVVNKGDTDMRPVLTRLVNAGAELVVFPLFSPEGDFLLAQVPEVTGTADTIFLGSLNSLTAETFLPAVEGVDNPLYFVVSTPPEGAAVEAVLAEYKATYGETPQNPAYPYGYDATLLLRHALEQVAIQEADGTLHIERTALRDVLYQTKNLSGLSGDISCNQFGDCSAIEFNIVQLTDATASLETLLSNVVYTLD